MFSEEVQEAKKETVSSRGLYPADLPSFAGRAALLKMRRNRLAYLNKVSLIYCVLYYWYNTHCKICTKLNN